LRASIDNITSRHDLRRQKNFSMARSAHRSNGTTLAIRRCATSAQEIPLSGGGGRDSLASLPPIAGTAIASAESPTAIVTTAIHQVSSARQQIGDFQTQAIQPFTDAGQSAARAFDPVAFSRSQGLRHQMRSWPQGLLQPAATLAFTPSYESWLLGLLR
jgi:hypothetical protein